MAVGKILVDASFYNVQEKELHWRINCKVPPNGSIMSDHNHYESDSLRKCYSLYVISFTYIQLGDQQASAAYWRPFIWSAAYSIQIHCIQLHFNLF